MSEFRRSHHSSRATLTKLANLYSTAMYASEHRNEAIQLAYITYEATSCENGLDSDNISCPGMGLPRQVTLNTMSSFVATVFHQHKIILCIFVSLQ